MIYPQFISKGDTLAITAPSNGVDDIIKQKSLDLAADRIKNDLGVKVIETPNVRTSTKGRSSNKLERVKELEELFLDKGVKAIICAAGGDFLYEILDELDYDIITNNPKWLQGYSDPTGLTYTITTKCDIATIYASNVAVFGMKKLHKSLEDNLEILKGNLIQQISFDKYESMRQDRLIGDEEYFLDKDVKWEEINDANNFSFSGRAIGGCLELINTIFGTKHDNTKEFIKKYSSDGFIWYIDIFALPFEEVILSLLKLKNEGYFSNVKGFIFGRILSEVSYNDYTYKEALKEVLDDLDVPVIFNADVGHVAPRITIINGAIMHVEYNNHSAKINFELK